MAITDAKKVDLLWKKIGFGKAKTDTNAAKKAANESIVSEFIIKPTSIWSDTSSIASTKPSANAGITIVYDELETTEDGTSTARRTWKTGVINWIPPTFGATYQLKVYVDSAGSGNPASNGAQLFETGSGNSDEWYFDYQSGTLHFIGTNLPGSVTSGKSIFVSGAKYNGNTLTTGLSTTLYNSTIDSLTAPLKTSDGGTGLNTFTAKGVFYASNTSTMAQATGTNGQVMQLDSNDTPTFDDLDGGTY